MEYIKNEIVRVYYIFLNEPGACVFVTGLFALVSVLVLRALISGLLEMHKSRSTMKKIGKEYGFWQKVILLPAWKENEHARKFCRFMIVLHHIRVFLMAGLLLMILFASVVPGLSRLAAIFSIIILIVVDLPIYVLSMALDRHPFRRRKHEYRFRKYHNTKDHDSLF